MSLDTARSSRADSPFPRVLVYNACHGRQRIHHERLSSSARLESHRLLSRLRWRRVGTLRRPAAPRGRGVLPPAPPGPGARLCRRGPTGRHHCRPRWLRRPHPLLPPVCSQRQTPHPRCPGWHPTLGPQAVRPRPPGQCLLQGQSQTPGLHRHLSLGQHPPGRHRPHLRSHAGVEGGAGSAGHLQGCQARAERPGRHPGPDGKYLGLCPGKPATGFKGEPYTLGVKRDGTPRIVQHWAPDSKTHAPYGQA
jgi:hypothetical protein